MDTITYENTRLRVTVSREIHDSYLPRAESLHRCHGQDVAKTLRGIILSEAMSILGNASEARLLERGDHHRIEAGEILALATDILVREYIEREGRYDWLRIEPRLRLGRTLSPGMQAAVLRARAYAQGILCPLTAEQALEAYTPLNWRAAKNILLATSPAPAGLYCFARSLLPLSLDHSSSTDRWMRYDPCPSSGS